MMSGRWQLKSNDKKFEQIIKGTFKDDDEYVNLFKHMDEANHITDALKMMIEDDELWEQLVNDKEDRAMFVAVVGVMSMRFMETLGPVADELFGDDEEE
jgi:hypothetical protein